MLFGERAELAGVCPGRSVLTGLRCWLQQLIAVGAGVSPVPLSLRWAGRGELPGRSGGWMRVDVTLYLQGHVN
jgi:hypothetical protein